MTNNYSLLLFILILSVTGACNGKSEPITFSFETDKIPGYPLFSHDEITYEEQYSKSVVDTTSTVPVEIILKHSDSANSLIRYVDQDITELKFFKTKAVSIAGLDQLKHLETIIFSHCSSLNDYSFLSDVPGLKRVFIVLGEEVLDWSFLERLPDLEVLHFEEYLHQTEITLNLKNNHRLEYIGFKTGLLESFPILLNKPVSLKFLSLEGNKISALPPDFENYGNLSVFLRVNPITRSSVVYDNIIFDSPNILGEYYCLPSGSNIIQLSDLY